MRISDWSSDVCSSDRAEEGQAAGDRWRAVARVEAERARCHLRHDREAAVQLDVIESFDITDDQFCAFAQHRFLRGAVRVGVALQIVLSSDYRRVGQECVRTCNSRCGPVSYNINNNLRK